MNKERGGKVIEKVIETVSLLPTEKQFTTKEMSLMTGSRLSGTNIIRTLRFMNCVNPVKPQEHGIMIIWQKVFDPNDHIFSSMDELTEYCNICRYREIKMKRPDCIILNRYKRKKKAQISLQMGIDEYNKMKEKK